MTETMIERRKLANGMSLLCIQRYCHASLWKLSSAEWSFMIIWKIEDMSLNIGKPTTTFSFFKKSDLVYLVWLLNLYERKIKFRKDMLSIQTTWFPDIAIPNSRLYLKTTSKTVQKIHAASNKVFFSLNEWNIILPQSDINHLDTIW